MIFRKRKEWNRKETKNNQCWQGNKENNKMKKIDETERQQSMKKRAGGESAEEKSGFDGAGCLRRAPIGIDDAPARAQPTPNRRKTLGSGPAQARDASTSVCLSFLSPLHASRLAGAIVSFGGRAAKRGCARPGLPRRARAP